MKRLIQLMVLFAGVVVFVSCGPSASDAVKLNSEIVSDQKTLLDKETLLFDVITNSNNTDSIKNSYLSYTQFINNTLKKYTDKKPFDKKDTFRKATIDLFTSYKGTADKEFKTIVDILCKSESLTNDDKDNIKKSLDIINETESKAVDQFLAAQKTFAEEYSIDLKDK